MMTSMIMTSTTMKIPISMTMMPSMMMLMTIVYDDNGFDVDKLCIARILDQDWIYKMY